MADLLIAQAPAIGATVLSRKDSRLAAVLPLTLPSGHTLEFVLQIDASSAEPVVREGTPPQLPTFCPNRHINPNGSFCMGFPTEEPLIVIDDETALAWWRRLWKFLDLQNTAGRLRRWPSKHEWAHGREAATLQGIAERSARMLGQRFVEALAARRLSWRQRKSTPAFIELREGPARVYSVWVNPGRVATQRQVCVCGSGKPMVACGDHALAAALLPFALRGMEREERRFWEELHGKPCCGKLLDCPLKLSSALPSAKAA